MATHTGSRTSAQSSNNRTNSSKSSDSNRSGNHSRSAFSWGNNAGPLLGAAFAGAAIGFAANYGRKLIMQGMEAAVGDWDEILAAEHRAALSLFDKMLATDTSQTFKRKMLVMKLGHALDKHAHEEETVVYPALRQDGVASDADHLESEHGYIKTFIYELNKIGPDDPNWHEKVREFRDLVHEHAKTEEEKIFPRFKREMTKEQNDRITTLVNRDGFWMA